MLVTSTDEDTFIDRFTILFTFSFGDRLVAEFTIAIQLFESFDRRLYREFTTLSFPGLYRRYTSKMKTFLAPLFWFLNRFRSFASRKGQKKNESIGRRIYFPALQQTIATVIRSFLLQNILSTFMFFFLFFFFWYFLLIKFNSKI